MDRLSDQIIEPALPAAGLRRVPWLKRLSAWVDERTGYVSSLARFFNYPVPLYVHKNLMYSLGGLTLISIALQFGTGILLGFYYSPSTVQAYDSVDFVTYQMQLGWLVRGIHVYNSSALIILAVMHLLRTFFTSAYKKPREFTWLTGVVMLLIVLAFAFTGALLPWDQSGYWATQVGTEIAATMPVGGDLIARLIRGGPVLGQAALNRFFLMHILLLPAVLVGLVVFHLHQLRYHGMAPSITRRGQSQARKFVPFFPHWMTVDGVLGFVLFVALISLSWIQRAPLEFPADPSSTEFVPRPQWFFLFLYQALKYFPGALEPLAAALIPGIIVGSLILLPFLDRSEERRFWRKPLTTSIALLFLFGIGMLTILSLLTP